MGQTVPGLSQQRVGRVTKASEPRITIETVNDVVAFGFFAVEVLTRI